MRFGRISEELFGGFSQSCGYGEFLQSIYMYRRHVAKGRETYLLGVKQKNKVVAAGIVVCMREVLGQKVFVCARGPLVDYGAEDAGEVLESWLRRTEEFVKRRGGMMLEVSPPIRHSAEVTGEVFSSPRSRRPSLRGRAAMARQQSAQCDENASPVTSTCAMPQEKGLSQDAFSLTKSMLSSRGYKDLGEYEQVKWIYTLETKGKSEDELFKSFRKGHKLSIKYATSRYGMRIRRLNKGQFKPLKELVDEAGERHHFRTVGEEYFGEMRTAFTPKNTKFMLAEMPNLATGEMIPVAGAMFVEYGGELVYLFSGSRAEYKKYGGPHLIQWEMIKYARKKGLKYNFYGVKPVEGDGVFDFKKGFHGQVEEYVGTFVKALTWRGKLYLMRKHYREFGEVA